MEPPLRAVTERQAPQLALAESGPVAERDLALPDPAERVGVDRAVAVVVADEQVAAELAPTRRRDGEPPGRWPGAFPPTSSISVLMKVPSVLNSSTMPPRGLFGFAKVT